MSYLFQSDSGVFGAGDGDSALLTRFVTLASLVFCLRLVLITARFSALRLALYFCWRNLSLSLVCSLHSLLCSLQQL